MKILSRKTGIIYENIALETKNGDIVDTETMSNINFNEYEFGYTYLCDKCAEIAGKINTIEAGGCLNYNCNCTCGAGEVTFSKEEILNDLVVYDVD